MSSLGIERYYDRNGDGRLDAGEFALYEMGNQKPRQSVTYRVNVSLVLNVDLPECWEAMQHGLMALVPEQYSQLLPLLAHTMVRAMACGLSLREDPLPQELRSELDQFLYSVPLLRDWSAEQLRYTVPYEEESSLTETHAGTFWQALIGNMRDPDETDGFDEISWNLSLVTAYCHGVNDGEEDRLQRALETCYKNHWYPTLPEEPHNWWDDDEEE